MTERIECLLEQLKSKEYRKKRHAAIFRKERPGGSPKERAEYFRDFVSLESPVLFEGDRLGFNRSTNVPVLDLGGNVTADYGRVLTMGFDAIAAEIKASMEGTDDAQKLAFGQSMLDSIETVYRIADAYREYAACGDANDQAQGSDAGKTCQTTSGGHCDAASRQVLARALERVPRQGAQTFHEACVFMKLLAFTLRLSGISHVTLGRFDQYMYPFFLADRERGVTDEELFEMVEEYFISINFDTDLYTGVQQGDNGQSMVLGGFDGEGNSLYNDLSQMCMEASLELKLIDPKINLRVGKNTPDSLYEFATTLTREGLGFPQYCNDDVVVPGLVKLGYAPEDAINYTVAACWEYIVPGRGADIPNLATMDFPHVVRDAMMDHLEECDTFPQLMEKVRESIRKECDRLVDDAIARTRSGAGAWWKTAHPLLSAVMNGCTKTLRDAFDGGVRYGNFGCHGAGIANAADALEAVCKTIYQDQSVTKQDLLFALDHDFEDCAELRNLLCDCPKMGNNEDSVDEIACTLMDTFAKAMNGRSNGVHGIWRAGTGSAMEYLWKGKKCAATADGRKAGEPYSSSFSPSLNARTDGLLSVIQSFTKYDMTNIINGGPLTIEVHDTVLRNEIGIQKTAMLVKDFILAGGHQLQINSVNRERLLDAQKHPENYPNLIVRVWGWSGYFNELDVEYQNHIIARTEYAV